MELKLHKHDEFVAHKEVIEKQIEMIEQRIEETDAEIEKYSAQYSDLVGTNQIEDTTGVSESLHQARQKKDQLIHELELVRSNTYQQALAKEIYSHYRTVKNQVNAEVERLYNMAHRVKQKARDDINNINLQMAELNDRFATDIMNKFRGVLDSLEVNPNLKEQLQREVSSGSMLSAPYPPIH